MYKDRIEAGELLLKALEEFRNNKNAIVVALPRGGVPVGYVIAQQLNLSLEVVLSKKIQHPFYKEFAIGAVTLEGRILSNDIQDISRFYIDLETNRLRELLIERQKLYYRTAMPLSLKDRIVIIVDDGAATGHTLISSIKLIEQKQPSKIIVALPVAPQSAIDKLRAIKSIDQIICLKTTSEFKSVGQYYDKFSRVNDREVIQLINNLKTQSTN